MKQDIALADHVSLCPTQLKETFVAEDCSQSCECTTSGAVCQTKSCRENEICTVYETKRDCYEGELLRLPLLLKHFINWLFIRYSGSKYLINISCIA